MSKYKIYPIKVGEFYLDHSSVCYATKPGQKILSPILCFLIRGEHESILVDTGCCNEEQARAHHMPVHIGENENLLFALKQHGLSPNDIKTVILTHLHWDHCYHNDLFPEANFIVQKKEIEFAENPMPCQCKAYETAGVGLTPPWIPTQNQFSIIDGDQMLCDGIQLLLLPGHTPGSMGVLVDTEEGQYLIAGDLIQSKVVFEELVCGLPKPSGVHSHLDQYYESLKRVMRLRVTILPAHEMDVLNYSAYPPETLRNT